MRKIQGCRNRLNGVFPRKINISIIYISI